MFSAVGRVIQSFFCGRARFVVENCGFSVLNRLRRYHLSQIEVGNGFVAFTVPLRHANSVKQALWREKVSVQANRNIFTVFNVFYARGVLSFCLVVVIAVLIFLSHLIFRIEYVGVTSAQERQVAQFVSEKQIKRLSFKSSVRNIADEIAQEFDFVAHVSSKIVGNTLIFNIYTVGVAGDKNNNNDIIATRDGIVTKVVVASGMAAVEVGDVVRRGDVLIRGQYRVGEEETLPCRAIGEVYADVKFSRFGAGESEAEILQKIITEAGIENFDKVETFTPMEGVLEVVATVNMVIS